MNLMNKRLRVKALLTILKNVFPNPKTALNYTKDYELLFAVIMSAQTTDKQVNIVTQTLFRRYPQLSDYLNADPQEFQMAINSLGFYRNKAKNVLAAAKLLHDSFQGKVPQTLADLITIPGVGRKTGNVVQRELFQTTEGVAVDTHVIRLSNQLGLTRSHDPIKIEQDLMRITPPSEWGNLSILLILYGREFWKARQVDKGILTKHLEELGF